MWAMLHLGALIVSIAHLAPQLESFHYSAAALDLVYPTLFSYHWQLT